jgi:hypothetical protein
VVAEFSLFKTYYTHYHTPLWTVPPLSRVVAEFSLFKTYYTHYYTPLWRVVLLVVAEFYYLRRIILYLYTTLESGATCGV